LFRKLAELEDCAGWARIFESGDMDQNTVVRDSKAPTKNLRRRFLQGCVLAGAALFTEMRLVEPNWLCVGRHRVPMLPPGSSPVRLLQLSDLHASDETPLDFIEQAVELGLAQKPDVVCLTGDFITSYWDEWNPYSRVLSRLSKSVPTFASTGNHDGGPWKGRHGGYGSPDQVIDMLQRADIQVLRNQAIEVRLAGKPSMELVGFGDLWSQDFRPEGLLDGTSSGPRILMSHNPDTKDYVAKERWDLMLSGHTHGGQLTIPFGGAPFAPVIDKRFIKGLYAWNQRWLHISKGVASTKNLRLNCFPEISLLELIGHSLDA
jgi:uncharacterized protein